MQGVICCDFEFMHANATNGKLIILTDEMMKKKSKSGQKLPVKKIAFVMTTGRVDEVDKRVTVKRFVSHSSDGLFTEAVCDKMRKELEEYRATVIRKNDIVVVWDKSGDKEFLDPENEIVDLREVFRHLKILRFPQFCSGLSPEEQKREMGLKAVAQRFIQNCEEVDSSCQTGNWNEPSEEMMKYAENDVVLLQKLIEYAKEKYECETFEELLRIAKENEEVTKENLEWLQKTRSRAIFEANSIAKNREDLTKKERNDLLTDALHKIKENFAKVDMEQLYAATSAYFGVYFIGQHSGRHHLVMYDYDKEPCETLFMTHMREIGVNPEDIRMKNRVKMCVFEELFEEDWFD